MISIFRNKKEAGFTMVEILIIIAIIAILASVVFVALDPLKRFRESRDSNRSSEVASILNAIKVDQVDNGGAYLESVATTTMATSTWYMIGTGSGAACQMGASDCYGGVTTTDCVDLTGLQTEGYLGSIPVSPEEGDHDWDDSVTGYLLQKEDSGILHARACECESENGCPIEISR
jgi:type IV pilus assembly protein PilA